MVKTSKPAKITQYKNEEISSPEEEVIVEKPVSLTVNGNVWLTFMCTPNDLEALAAGFLFNENVIESKDDIADIYICENQDNVDIWLNKKAEEPNNWRRTSGCTGGYTAAVLEEIKPVKSKGMTLSPESILRLIRQLFDSQEIYRKTGGVHSSGLSDGDKILIVTEDVGRHNTLDKIAGKYILEDVKGKPMVLMSTGRISSEMLQKAARLQVPVLVSRTSPTSMSVELAKKLGITLIGYARGHRFNIYTHPERIELKKEPA